MKGEIESNESDFFLFFANKYLACDSICNDSINKTRWHTRRARLRNAVQSTLNFRLSIVYICNRVQYSFLEKEIAHLCHNLDEFFLLINIGERYILTSWTKSKLNWEIDIMKFIATRTLRMHINMFFRNTID